MTTQMVSTQGTDGTRSQPLGEQLSIRERLVLAPCPGRFRMAPTQHYTTEGEYVIEDQVVGVVVDGGGEQVEVRTSFSGWVMGFLIRDGYPVREGEAVLWLRKL